MENKEIDLLDLGKRFKIYLRKNFWLFLALLIFGAATGYIYAKYKKPSYSTTGVFSTWLKEDLFIKILEVFEEQVKNKNIAYLSSSMNMPDEKVKNIISLEFLIPERDHRMKPESSEFDNIRNKTLVSVEVVASNKETLIGIEKYFINFFNNNNTLHAKFLQRKNLMEKMLDEIEAEILAHKNRNELHFDRASKINSLFYMDYKVRDFLFLIVLKSDIELELSNNNIITFTQDFSTPLESSASTKKYILLFSVSFVLLGAIIKSFWML